MADPQDSKGKGPAQDASDGAEKKSSGTTSKEIISELGKSGKKTIPSGMVDTLLKMNPALASELADMPKEKAVEVLSKMDVSELLTGMSLGNKNQKDMASYKFWQTQPVPRFDDKGDLTEGPIKVINPEEVSKDPSPLIEGFEWVTLDLTDDNEVAELYDLLSNHYVEDDNAMFRFNYSRAFLNWYAFSTETRNWWYNANFFSSVKGP
jgi:glycylpeptide N-tetradecanoyltransferase